LREETRRRFERLVWIDRAKKIGIGAAIVVAIGVAFGLENLDMMVTDSRVDGTIEAIDPLVSKTSAADGVNVGIKLDDGRHVRVIAAKTRNPHVGERIEVTEHHHATGRVTHTLR
jgi:outer membrane lipoprotein SlyB